MTTKAIARCGNREQGCSKSCQGDDHWTGETGWTAQGVCLGTGNWQGRTTQAVGTVVGQLGKAARGQGRLLRSVAQMLERQAETLRMIAWGKQTGPQKSMNPSTQSTQNQGAG